MASPGDRWWRDGIFPTKRGGNTPTWWPRPTPHPPEAHTKGTGVGVSATYKGGGERAEGKKSQEVREHMGEKTEPERDFVDLVFLGSAEANKVPSS